MESQANKIAPPFMRLRDRALKAGAWTLGAHGFDLAVRLVANLALTRLLFPEAFGVVAAATAMITGLELISDFGVRTIIIQSPRADQVGFLRSAWIFQLTRGVLVWLVLVSICGLLSVLAPQSQAPGATVFADPLFPVITAVLGFNIVLNGAESIAVASNIRALNFKPIVLLDVAGRLLPLPIMLIWAFLEPSLWALVAGGLIGGVCRLILSHTIVPGPRMVLMKANKEHVQEIVRVGKWITLSSCATFLCYQSDVVILGLLLPTAQLGIYSIATLLLSALETLIDRLGSSLALPVLSEVVRNSPQNLRRDYYRFRLPIDLVAALISGVLFISGGFVVDILYDHRYSEAGLMLQVLALGLAIYPLQLIKNAFIAIGETRILAGFSVLQAISIVFCMLVGYALLGTLGAVAGIAVHRIVPSMVVILFASRRNWISLWKEFRLVPMFFIGVLMGEAALWVAQPAISYLGHLKTLLGR
jgi:O-antigen/teichoic acid export membrane protein